MAANSQLSLRDLILRTARGAGLFQLSHAIFRKRLPILCFHGFELTDEARFRPKLFMQAEVFRARLLALRRAGFTVLPLGEALTRLRARQLPAKSVSITIDDGFYSVLAQAAPILREFSMPATLYVTSYYVLKRAPIFGLAVQYLIWKTALRGIDLAPLSIPALNRVDLATTAARDAVASAVMHYGGLLPDEPARQDLCRRLAALLDIDYDAIIASRQLSLLTRDELARLADFGIDVELHTHRHRLSATDEAEMVREIRDNRAVLEPAIGRSTRHFCYPSGQWLAAQWPRLASENIVSATTCDPGLNHPDTPLLGLYRTLDANDMSQVAIDAEIHGFGDLVRAASGRRRFTDAARGSARQV